MNSKTNNNQQYVLKVSCVGDLGIIAVTTTFLTDQGCYINELSQFEDQMRNFLFMRVNFHIAKGNENIKSIKKKFIEIAENRNMEWELFSASAPTRTLIMVSKFDHCLDDLLYRLHKRELNIEITAIVSNHKDLRPMAEREGIRFIHLPINKENKNEQEDALREIVDETKTELIILARYMQILSDQLSKELVGRVINIHHSFLPGFKGAKPYHQAFERGVKLIGATAHYVTSDLDEGPIIEQAVQPVDHTFDPEMLVTVGRDTETVALAKAVKLHTEHRVFLDGNKTVVFR